MWLVFCWTRYSCGNTQNTQNWGQPFPVHSSSSSPYCFFPAWLSLSLRSVGAALKPAILVSTWTAGMLADFEVRRRACGLDKMDQGKRRSWVISEKWWGARHASHLCLLSPSFSVRSVVPQAASQRIAKASPLFRYHPDICLFLLVFFLLSFTH